MKRYINRLILAVAALFAMAGTAKGQALASEGSVTNADVKWFVSDTEPTAAPSGDGAASVSITAGQWVIIKVTPSADYWIYKDMLTLQPVGGTGGAEARQRAVILPANPTALSTNSADGTGYYYYQIPATCTTENGYTKVIVAGSAIEKIDLGTATRSTDGKTITTADRADGWKAVITLDEVSFTYNGSAQGPTISSFSLKNGTDEFSSTIADHVSISGTGTYVNNYNATMSAVTGGCLTTSKAVPFTITQNTTAITVIPGSGSKVYDGTPLTKTAHEDFTVTGVPAGFTWTATADGTVTNVIQGTGEKTVNAVTSFKIFKDGTDATDQFSGIDKTATGTLSITQKTVTLASGSKSRDYNGSALTNAEVEGKNANGLTTETGWADGEGATYTFTGSQTTVGSSANAFTYTLKSGTVASNYDIKKTEGTLTITVKDISDAEVTVNDDPAGLVYDGNPKTPDNLTVTLNGKELTKDVDYEITGYKNNTAAGSATITLTGKGNYSGTVDGTFTISTATGELTFGDITKIYGDVAFDVAPSTVDSQGAITYVSGNTDVVTVSGNTLTIVGQGEATITATQAASGSYAEVTKTFKVTVKKATLTVTANDKTITYGEAPANDGVTYSGFVNNETESVLSGTLAYSYKEKEDGTGNDYSTSCPVGTYYIIPSGLTSTNYDITFVAGKLTVSDSPIVIGGDDDPSATAKIVIDPTEFTYNGQDQKPAVKVVMKAGNKEIASTEYDVKYRKGNTDVTEMKDAGTYTVVITNKTGSNYTFSGTTTASYEIKPAALTVTAKDKTVKFGDEAANDGVTYSGFVNNETESVLSGTLSYSYKEKEDGTGNDYSTSSPVGTYYIIPAGLTSTNYDITFVAGKLTVSDSPIVIGGDDDPSATAKIVIDPTEFTYNGKDQKPTVKVVLKAGNKEIASTEYDVKYRKGNTDVTETKDAGTYTVVITNKTGSNYTFSGTTTASYEIKPAALTVTAKDKTVKFGDEAANDGVTYSGFVNNETESVLSGTLSYSYKEKKDGTGNDYSTSSPVGTYYIIPAGLTSTNYDITFVAGKLTVSDSPIVIGGDDDPSATAKIVIDPTEFTYNGKDQKPTVKVVLKAGNKEIASTEYDVKYRKGNTDVTETKDAGTYTVVITNKTGSNYTFSGATTADYVIKPAALTVTAKDKTVKFGDEAANDGVTYSGFVNEETSAVLTGTLTYTYKTKDDGTGDDYTKESPVGTYYIIPSGLTSTNYTITFVAGKLTVSKDVIVIGGDDDATATAKIVIDPTEFTYNGKDQKPAVKVVLKAGNKEIATTEYDVKYRKGNADVTETKDAGTYTVVITNKTGSDYAFSGATTANYEIKPAALTVTAKDKTIKFGDEAANDGVTYSGFVNNETESVLSGTLSYSYKEKEDGTGNDYSTSSPVGTYYIIPAGLTSTNYDITFVAGKLTVSDSPIVIGGDDDPSATAKIVIDPTEFTYNGKDQKPAVKVVMKAGNKEIASTEYDVKYRKGNTDVTETKDAGTYTVVITNKTGSNYTFSGTTTASYVINTAKLTVTAKDKTVKFGDEAANDGVTYSGFVNNETESVLSGTLSYSYKEKKDGTGNDYSTSSPVGTYYIIPSGLTSTNYDITFVAGKLTVSDSPIVIGGDDDPSATAKIVIDPTEFTYNGKDQKPTVKVVLKAGNKEIASTEYDVKYRKGNTDVTETKDAGTYTVVITNKTGSNYTFSGTTTADYVIKPAALTVTAKDKTVKFGDEAANDGVTYSGFVNNETESVLSGTLSYSYKEKKDGTGNDYSTSSPVGTYYIIPAGLTSTNYDITFVAGKLTVSDSPIVIGGDDPSATAKIVIDPTEFTYNGQDQKPTVKVVMKAGNKEIASTEYDVKYRKGNTDVTETKDAGTYTVVITNKTGSNYTFSGTTTADYVIKPAPLTITAKDQTITFGESIAQDTEQVTITSGSLATGDALTSIVLNPSGQDVTDTGTITPSDAVIKKDDNDMTANYDITYKNGKLVINPSDVASAVVTAKNRDYDGTTQTLVEIGTVVNGATNTESDVVFYESATSTTKLTDTPQGTNAGTYDIYYEVTPDVNHSSSGRKHLTVTIKAITASVTITGHNNTAVYDGNKHSVSGYDVEISTPLYTEADFTFSGTATAERTETGMTMMGLAADQFKNTSPNFSEVTFNITDGYQTITSPEGVIVKITGHSNTADYDGTEHSVSGYDVEISNPLYTEADFTFSGTATAAQKDAGTKMMGLDASQFENKNKNFGTVTFVVTDGYQEISPIAATVTITGHNNTLTYDGTEHSVTGYDVSISNELYKEADFTFSGTAEAKRTDEGTTNMGLAADQFTNNNTNFNPVTFNVTDGYMEITSVTDVVVTITGHNNTADYDGTEHKVSGYDVKISNPLYKESDFTFSGTATAAQKDAGTKMMGLDASQFENKNNDFTSVTFKVTDGYQTISPIAATVTITGHNNVAIYDGSEHSVTGYDVSFSNDLYKQTDFTFSGTAGAAQTYKGTTNMGLAVDQFKNTSANFSTVTFNVIDGYQTITPRSLTITADDQTIDYGTDIVTDLTKVTAAGLQGSDELTAVTLVASTTELTSDGTITPSAVVIKNGEKDVTENYDITYNTGTLIIEYVLDLKAGYVTFCSPFDLLLPATGLTAYTVSAVSEADVELQEQTAIGKDVPMILYVETAGIHKLRKGDPQNFSSVQEFVGVTSADGDDVSTIIGEVYILKDGKFVWSREGVVPQYHCYAVLNSTVSARSLNIVVGESTGIGNLQRTDDEGYNWYSVDGRKLEGRPTAKGLYIVIPADGRSKGKKVMIK